MMLASSAYRMKFAICKHNSVTSELRGIALLVKKVKFSEFKGHFENFGIKT